MSYVIHIWQTPIPTSVLQADKICDRLQDKEGRQNPKFIEQTRTAFCINIGKKYKMPMVTLTVATAH